MNRLTLLASITLCALLLTACTLPGLSPDSKPQPTVQIAVTIYATTAPLATPVPAQSQTPVPALSPTPVPTAAPSAPSDCPPRVQSPGAPVKPATFTDTVASVVSVLNTGATSTETLELLKGWGVIFNLPGIGGQQQQQGGIVHARLLPAPDAQMVVWYTDPADAQLPTRKSELLVLSCEKHAYTVLYKATEDPELAGQATNARVFSTADVTGDSRDDLSFILEDCSDSTCFDGFYILTAVNGALVNAIPDIEWSPSPTFEYLPGSGTEKSAKDLRARIGLLGSVGVGPQRTVTDTWTVEGNGFTRTLSVIDPPIYRIHALMDGDSAFRRKDVGAARLLYERVVGDSTLKSWAGNAPLRDEPQVLAAFALFRLMQLAGASGDGGGVTKAYDNLVVLAPPKSAGLLYQQMAEAFMTVYKQGADYPKSCEAALHFAEKNKNVYVVIGQDTFGSANYDYQAPDMCIVPQ